MGYAITRTKREDVKRVRTLHLELALNERLLAIDLAGHEINKIRVGHRDGAVSGGGSAGLCEIW